LKYDGELLLYHCHLKLEGGRIDLKDRIISSVITTPVIP
jgi:hypothetical protein